jgi:hypothetical protein
MELRQTYAGWADKTAAELSGVEDDATFQQRLEERVDELIAALILLGRRHLPEAHALGLAGVPASPEGMRELAQAVEENDRYLMESLGPAIVEKVGTRTAGDPLIRGDKDSLGGVFNTFLGRAASYAGAAWALTNLALGDRAKQQEAAALVLLRRAAGEGVEIRADEAKVSVYWHLDPSVKNHCATCLQFGNRMYDSWDDMLAETGGILPSRGTICNGNCRCSTSVVMDSKPRRVWTHLAREGTGLPPLATGYSDDEWLELFGGPGSGHWGHKGIKGSRGGSTAGGGGIALAGNAPISADEASAVVERHLAGDSFKISSSRNVSSDVYEVDDYVVKKPRPGNEFMMVEYGAAQEVASKQLDFVPATRYYQSPESGPVLIQRKVTAAGATVKPKETLGDIDVRARAQGYTPHDLQWGNASVDANGKTWVFDIDSWDFPVDVLREGTALRKARAAKGRNP